MRKLFYNDYNDIQIIEYQDYNKQGLPKGHPRYKLQFAKYGFGIKYYSIFQIRPNGMGKKYFFDFESYDKDIVLERYQDFLKKLNSKYEFTKIKIIK
jgi:hypothetical protein